MAEGIQTHRFDTEGLERVVADPLRFKKQLRIGEEAYAFLRAKNRLAEVWDTVGAGATGAAVANSTVVASTFFASAPTGVAAWLGLAAPAAVTPVGWVVAAAVVAGGGYYGVTRWFTNQKGAFVETVPKYINTPVDVLGARLFDLFGSLALRVSAIDGHIDEREVELIADHFEREWGYDRLFISRAMPLLVSESEHAKVKLLARDLAQFQAANPDCNASAMQTQLMSFLRELIGVDGKVDEREELALEAIDRTLQEQRQLSVEKVGRAFRDFSSSTGEAISSVAGNASSYARGFANRVQGVLRKPPEVGF